VALPPDPRGLSLWFPGGQRAAAQEKATRYSSPPSRKSGNALGSCLHVALSSSPAKRRQYITVRRGRTTTKQILYLTWGTLQLAEDKREGFLAGTDDYMTKPVDMQEMLLRIRALLRRSQIVSERRLQIGEVTLDYDSLTVTRGNDTQTLPKKEFYLLYKLLSSPNKIFTRIQLMDEIWGMESESGDITVNVHMNRLRRRFENYPDFELVSVRGLGYKAVKKG